MDKVLLSPIHVIATARARTEWAIEEKNGKQTPKKLGLEQQQDKDISYEYTVSFMIDQETHVASVDKDNTGYYDGVYEVLTEADGERLYNWANEGDTPAPKPVQQLQKADPLVDEAIAITLDSVKAEVVGLATKLVSINKNATLDAIRKYDSHANPKNITSLDDAMALLEDLKAIEQEVN